MTVADLFGTGALAVLLAVALVVTFTLLARERRATRALRAQQPSRPGALAVVPAHAAIVPHRRAGPVHAYDGSVITTQHPGPA